MSRTLLALASALAALALGWLVLRPLLSEPPPPLTVVPAPPLDPDAALWRERMETEHPPVPIRAFEDTTLAREVTAEALMPRLYPQVGRGMTWHPQRSFRRPSDLEQRHAWPELEAGGWALATNHAGWRHRGELEAGRPVLAITGDSHLEGACALADTAAGRVAAALAGADLQVLNAACGGYSAHQYLGVLEDLCDDLPGELVDPDRPVDLEALVVGVYGGNDWTEVLRLAHWNARTDRPRGWGRDNARIAPWRATHAPALAQAVDAAVYLRNNPTEADRALAETLAVCEELSRHAERRGIRLLVLYLPSALEVEPERHPDHFDALLADLELTADQLAEVHGLGDRFLAGLGDLGVDFRALRPAFRASPVQLFWDRDLHLVPDGHALVADVVLDWYRGPDDE